MSFAHRKSDQMRPPPDHRNVNRRARWQPLTSVTATRGNNTNMTFTRKKSLSICTYNTRTISDLNEENKDLMINELEHLDWDIVGLSETKIKHTENFRHSSGHWFYTSGNNSTRSNGVAFLVNKSIADTVQNFQPISDRLATISIQSKLNKVIIIQVYFPTTSYDDSEVDSLYEEIARLLDKIPQRDYVFLNGDFNARVGGLNISSPKVVGRNTMGKFNDRGQKLVDFCTRHNLAITNTMFQKRRLHTWTSPKGNLHQIDFMLVRQRHIKAIHDSEALNLPDISDHRLIRSKLKLNFSWYKPKQNLAKFDLAQLKNMETKTLFQTELQNKFSPLLNLSDESTRAETLLDNICTGIKEAASKTLPRLTKQKSDLNPHTQTAINNKKEIRKTKGHHSAQYKVAKAEVKKLVRKDKLYNINKDCDIISTLPPGKQYYQAIKRLKSTRRSTTWGIKDKNGKILTDKSDILERWADFYQELYNDPNPAPASEPNTTLLAGIPEILVEETEIKMEKLKDNKKPGIDQILSEFIKSGGNITAKALTKLFNIMTKTGDIPMPLKQALIVVIFKKGDRLKCTNYRPISLLSNIYKLYISIITERIKNDLYQCLPSSQAAYQPGRNTIEQIISLEQMIEKSLEFNLPMHIVFIDFKKAFDSLKLESLWSLLETTPINKAYIHLLKLTYDGSTASIKCDIGITRIINILRGVKQGDILSPLLFCIVIAAVLYKTEEDTKHCRPPDQDCTYSGYSIGGQVISNLGYADDIAAINANKYNLQMFLSKLAKYAEEVGLKINIDKTKCMTTDKQNRPLNLKVQGHRIEQVDEFQYLGHNISNSNNHLTAIKHRISLGWAAFNNNSQTLKSSHIPSKVKGRLFTTYVLPVVLYGMDCVAWTQNLIHKMEVFQNHAMRIMTGHRLIDHKPITELRAMTGLKPMEALIRSKTLKLFGHIRRSTKGLAKLCFEGMIEGQRSRGAPSRRWKDNITEWSQIDNWNTINSMSLQREHWKTLSSISAQSATLRRSER